MRVVVLGAGASRGASFVDPTARPCLPPLDNDFLAQLRRIAGDKHATLIEQVTADVYELFGPVQNVSLETLFTTLEHSLRMVAATRGHEGFAVQELRAKRSRLLQAIAAVFENSLQEENEDGHRTHAQCQYHTNLVKRLSGDDAILSFNYDCLIDNALKNMGVDNGDGTSEDSPGKWDPRRGYGFDLRRGDTLDGHQHWCSRTSTANAPTIYLYKLHGSMHFRITYRKNGSAHISLKQKPYTSYGGSLRFEIIPPEWNKPFDWGVFARIWKQAALKLYRAEHLIFIGYSLPMTDMHSTALFRMNVRQDGLLTLVVVNPDREVLQRTVNVVQRGITKSTKVIHVDNFAQFDALEPALWGAETKNHDEGKAARAGRPKS